MFTLPKQTIAEYLKASGGVKKVKNQTKTKLLKTKFKKGDHRKLKTIKL